MHRTSLGRSVFNMLREGFSQWRTTSSSKKKFNLFKWRVGFGDFNVFCGRIFMIILFFFLLNFSFRLYFSLSAFLYLASQHSISIVIHPLNISFISALFHIQSYSWHYAINRQGSERPSKNDGAFWMGAHSMSVQIKMVEKANKRNRRNEDNRHVSKRVLIQTNR